MISYWALFTQHLCSKKPAGYAEVRKIFHDQKLVIPYDCFNLELEAKSIGYSSWKTKLKQLDTYYFNLEELNKVNLEAKRRFLKGHFCLTARFGNKEKRKESMGICLQTITLNYVEGELNVDVYYRSTEVTQKFLADLKFLQDKVLPILLEGLLVKPAYIRFRFASLYISPVFLPIMVTHCGVDLIKSIVKNDSYWWEKSVRTILDRYMMDDNPYGYRTRVIQWDVFNEYVKPKLTKKEVIYLKTLRK